MSTEAAAPAPENKRLSWAFWMLCIMEGWERLAYFGLVNVWAVYISQADLAEGLHWSQADRGWMMAWFSALGSLLPMFTGGFADRYGYKQTIFVSITLKVAGYIVMALSREYWPFFGGAMLLATGTALFKPGIQGSLAQNLTKENGSLGWGIFYWLVNVGGMIGPPFASWLKGYGWSTVFWGCAAIAALNYGMLLTYKEQQSGADMTASPWKVLLETGKNILNLRLVLLLLILTGFWLMMYQLWDFHPVFITDWIDTEPLLRAMPWLPDGWIIEGLRGRQLEQEHLLNLNATLIVLLVVPLSRIAARVRTLTAMMGGMFVATLGILATGLTQSVWLFLLGVLFFSLGEMFTGPKKTEYFAYIAPPGKKALYLGYVNIPVGLGRSIGAVLAANIYGATGERAMLAQRYLAEHPEVLGRSVAWSGDPEMLEAATGVSRADAFAFLCERLGQDGRAVTDLLWDAYDPWIVWLPIAAIGLVSTIALFAFGQAARKWSDMNH